MASTSAPDQDCIGAAEVLALLNPFVRSLPSLHRLAREKKIPAPLPWGGRRSIWRKRDVEAWVEAVKAGVVVGPACGTTGR